MHRFCRPRCASPDRGGGKCHHARSCVRNMNARVATSKRGGRIQDSHPHQQSNKYTPTRGQGWALDGNGRFLFFTLYCASFLMVWSSLAPSVYWVFLTLSLRLSCVAEISYFSRKSGNLSLNFLKNSYLRAHSVQQIQTV